MNFIINKTYIFINKNYISLKIKNMLSIMKAVKVPLKQLNDIRIDLMEKEIMRKDYKIKTEDGFGYIPIYEGFDLDLEIVDIQLDELKIYPKDFTDLLKDKLSTEESNILKTSFDIIGDIVIVEIPEDLESKKSDIGKATLEFTKRKSVYMKRSAVHGETRIRDLELIAGEDNAVTIHKEHGVRLQLNVEEVYFSPRLAAERKRVADSVKNNDSNAYAQLRPAASGGCGQKGPHLRMDGKRPRGGQQLSFCGCPRLLRHHPGGGGGC